MTVKNEFAKSVVQFEETLGIGKRLKTVPGENNGK